MYNPKEEMVDIRVMPPWRARWYRNWEVGFQVVYSPKEQVANDLQNERGDKFFEHDFA